MQVLFAVAVARLASGGAGIPLDAVLGLIDGQDRFRLTFVVALGAHRILVQGRRCSSGFALLRRRICSE